MTITEHRCTCCGQRVGIYSPGEGTNSYVRLAEQEVDRLRQECDRLRILLAWNIAAGVRWSEVARALGIKPGKSPDGVNAALAAMHALRDGAIQEGERLICQATRREQQP